MITRHPVFKLLKKNPSLATTTVSLGLGFWLSKGNAHLGHCFALSDTSDLHSGQFINAIFYLDFSLMCDLQKASSFDCLLSQKMILHSLQFLRPW